MTVSWHVEAQDEFDDAVARYRSERVELGWRFRTAVVETIERITQDPTSYERVKSSIHRCRVRRLPYCIVYSVETGDHIEVVAVSHHHRDFEYWDSRIRRK